MNPVTTTRWLDIVSFLLIRAPLETLVLGPLIEWDSPRQSMAR
jgi:hypothetical protein